MTRSTLAALAVACGLYSANTCNGDDIQTQVTTITVGAGMDAQQATIVENQNGNLDFPFHGSVELHKSATKQPVNIEILAFWDDSAADNLNPRRYAVTVVQATVTHGIHGMPKSEPLLLEVSPVTGAKLKWQTTIPPNTLKSNQVYYLELSAHKGNLESPTYRLKLLVP